MNFKRFLFLVRVEGLSCWPYLRPGRRYLATSLAAPQKGDFAVFRDKDQNRFLVKKVAAKKENIYRLKSTFGCDNVYDVPSKNIEGKLILPRLANG